MLNLKDFINATTIVSYYEEAKQNDYIFSNILPNLKQDKLTVSEIHGVKGLPRILRPRALDAEPSLRKLEKEVEGRQRDLILFSEGIALGEKDRQELYKTALTNNEDLLEMQVGRIIESQADLIAGAEVRSEQLRVQALTEGKITVNDNGVELVYDYGMEGNTQKVKNNWSDPATATPLADLDKILADNRRYSLSNIVMSRKTFNEMIAAEETKTVLGQLYNVKVTLLSEVENMLHEFFKVRLGVNIIINEDAYEDQDGEVVNMFPDDVVLFLPSGNVGSTIYGPTPEEFDFLMNKELNNPAMDISLYDDIVTVISNYQQTTPVTIRTTASMYTVPALTRKNSVQVLKTSTTDPTGV